MVLSGTNYSNHSISVLQWLCNADKSHHNPVKRLSRFFTTLYSSLRRGARAVFQFYPENDKQLDLIMTFAIKSGFTGGLVVDYPNSQKAKKFYLCLFAGRQFNEVQELPKGLEQEAVTTVRRTAKARSERKGVKDRNWILHKKEVARRRGKDVVKDSKYSGRKRKTAF